MSLLYSVSRIGMPNLVRRPRQCRPLRISERSRDLTRQPRTKLTYKERCRIFTLSDLLYWKPEVITTAIGLARITVQSVIRSKVETQIKQIGKKPIIISSLVFCSIKIRTALKIWCSFNFKLSNRLFSFKICLISGLF